MSPAGPPLAEKTSAQRRLIDIVLHNAPTAPRSQHSSELAVVIVNPDFHHQPRGKRTMDAPEQYRGPRSSDNRRPSTAGMRSTRGEHLEIAQDHLSLL